MSVPFSYLILIWVRPLLLLFLKELNAWATESKFFLEFLFSLRAPLWHFGSVGKPANLWLKFLAFSLNCSLSDLYMQISIPILSETAQTRIWNSGKGVWIERGKNVDKVSVWLSQAEKPASRIGFEIESKSNEWGVPFLVRSWRQSCCQSVETSEPIHYLDNVEECWASYGQVTLFYLMRARKPDEPVNILRRSRVCMS